MPFPAVLPPRRARLGLDRTIIELLGQDNGREFERGEKCMTDVIYVSKSRIERKQGPLRVAYLPGEPQPVYYSVHGAIAEHYRVDPEKIKEPHSSTIDYVISATAA